MRPLAFSAPLPGTNFRPVTVTAWCRGAPLPGLSGKCQALSPPALMGPLFQGREGPRAAHSQGRAPLPPQGALGSHVRGLASLKLWLRGASVPAGTGAPAPTPPRSGCMGAGHSHCWAVQGRHLGTRPASREGTVSRVPAPQHLFSPCAVPPSPCHLPGLAGQGALGPSTVWPCCVPGTSRGG